MRRALAILVVPASLALALPAGAKEPVHGKVCGRSGCASFTGASLSFAGTNVFYRQLSPAPYFKVTITLPPNVIVPWPSGPIIYVPSKARWRVTMYGTPAWYDVPDVDAAALKRAIRGLRPFRAPARWPS